jgi:hypothetical protein
MKKILMLLLLSVIVFTACKSEKSEEKNESTSNLSSTFDSTALQTTAIDKNEQQPFFLRYKFLPGKTVKYRLTTISKTEQTVTADSTRSERFDQTLIFIIDFKTLSIDQDSVADLECTFTSINLKASAKGQEYKYQSGTQIDSATRFQFAEYEALVSTPFNLRVNHLGSVIDIYKADRILNKFLDIRNLSDSVDAQQKILAAEDLTGRSIKPLITQIFREVPKQKIGVDSTWSYKRESLPVLVFQVDYENHYKLSNLELLGDDEMAVITGSVKTNVTGEQNRIERGITYNFDKPISKGTGKIYFNINKGFIQKSRTEATVQNGYKMEMPTPQGIQKARAVEITTNINVVELL